MSNFLVIVCVCLLPGLSECQAGENDTLSELSESPAEDYDNQSFQREQASALSPLNATSQAGCEATNYILWKQLGALEERLDATVRALEEKLEASERQVAALDSTVNELRAVTQGRRLQVAFSAALPGDATIGAVNADHPLVYQHVVSNIGNAYSQITGYFTAPVQGVYYFSFSSFFWGGDGSSGGSLHHNGNKVVSWYGYSSSHPVSGSNSAVLLLRAGDKVNVRLWAGRKISDNGNRYCTFSGFLLFSM